MKRLFSHASLAVIEGALVAGLVAALMVGTAFAGKGGGGGGKASGGGSLSLVMVTDVNGNGGPNWSDTVTFNADTAATSQPHVQLKCSQNGSVVYTHDAGMYASYPWPWEQNMTLSSSLWGGGAADCRAQIYYFSGSKTVWGTILSFTTAA